MITNFINAITTTYKPLLLSIVGIYLGKIAIETQQQIAVIFSITASTLAIALTIYKYYLLNKKRKK